MDKTGFPRPGHKLRMSYACCSLQVHVLTPIGTKVSKLVLQETFDEPSNVVDKPLKVEN